MHAEPVSRQDASGQRLGMGVDIGGSGVKGAIVNLDTGELHTDRIRVDTPKPATPEAVARVVADIVAQFGWSGPVGVTVPAVVKDGVTYSAANIDPSWIGTDARALFTSHLGNRSVTVLNDADAAGIAELTFGAGRGENGLVILLTFGTGIGSAILYNGVLIPNSELGHLEVSGKEAEHRAAASVRERKTLSWEEWADEVSLVLSTYDALFSPDLYIAGGGVSKKSDKWLPLLTTKTRIIPAQLRNHAGIVGGAIAAYSK